MSQPLFVSDPRGTGERSVEGKISINGNSPKNLLAIHPRMPYRMLAKNAAAVTTASAQDDSSKNNSIDVGGNIVSKITSTNKRFRPTPPALSFGNNKNKKLGIVDVIKEALAISIQADEYPGSAVSSASDSTASTVASNPVSPATAEVRCEVSICEDHHPLPHSSNTTADDEDGSLEALTPAQYQKRLEAYLSSHQIVVSNHSSSRDAYQYPWDDDDDFSDCEGILFGDDCNFNPNDDDDDDGDLDDDDSVQRQKRRKKTSSSSSVADSSIPDSLDSLNMRKSVHLCPRRDFSSDSSLASELTDVTYGQ